jgi:nicotinamide-nucleotide amidase
VIEARDPLTQSAADLLEACRQARLHLATAESYSNEAKQELLGVSADLLAKHGAVSPHVARAMAMGALERSRADLAVSVTGIAGPDGGTPTKPVGLVYLAACRRGGEPMVERHSFAGDRHAIRAASVEAAFLLLRAQLAS